MMNHRLRHRDLVPSSRPRSEIRRGTATKDREPVESERERQDRSRADSVLAVFDGARTRALRGELNGKKPVATGRRRHAIRTADLPVNVLRVLDEHGIAY